MNVTLRDKKGNEQVVDLAGIPEEGDQVEFTRDGKLGDMAVKGRTFCDGGKVIINLVDGFGRT